MFICLLGRLHRIACVSVGRVVPQRVVRSCHRFPLALQCFVLCLDNLQTLSDPLLAQTTLPYLNQCRTFPIQDARYMVQNNKCSALEMCRWVHVCACRFASYMRAHSGDPFSCNHQSWVSFCRSSCSTAASILLMWFVSSSNWSFSLCLIGICEGRSSGRTECI